MIQCCAKVFSYRKRKTLCVIVCHKHLLNSSLTVQIFSGKKIEQILFYPYGHFNYSKLLANYYYCYYCNFNSSSLWSFPYGCTFILHATAMLAVFTASCSSPICHLCIHYINQQIATYLASISTLTHCVWTYLSFPVHLSWLRNLCDFGRGMIVGIGWTGLSISETADWTVIWAFLEWRGEKKARPDNSSSSGNALSVREVRWEK